MSEAPKIVPLSEAAKLVSSALGFEPRALTPDAIAAKLHGLGWVRISNWEDLDDLDIADKLGLLRLPAPRDDVIVVTEASFNAAHGAFIVRGSGMRALIATHRAQYGECFFNGDVVAVAPKSKEVWLFHHEGAYTHHQIG